MAKETVLWGAETIRGELLKLDIQVAIATVRKNLRLARPPRTPCETWSVFLKNHAKDVWACDFLPVIGLFFRTVYLFFVVDFASRRIVHYNVSALIPRMLGLHNNYARPRHTVRGHVS